MKKIKYTTMLTIIISLHGCGTLDSKTIMINTGDSKEEVLAIMGVPKDRQLEQGQEAWQYCVSGAGLGYNDHKIIWFDEDVVTGITSYKSSRSGCTGALKTIKWEDAPDVVIETRER